MARMTDLDYEFQINNNVNYLNNAAYDPVPRTIIKSVNDYLVEYSTKGPDTGNVSLDTALDECRKEIASFINSSEEEVVLTQSITHGINIIAEGYNFLDKENIILREAEKEHVANFLPWLKVSKERNLQLKIFGSDELGYMDLSRLEKYMTFHKGGIISLAHSLYNLGTILPIRKICDIAHKYDYLVFVDAGQTLGARSVDVKTLGCDFLAFSGYKWLCAPPGIGALYINKSVQRKISYYGMDVRSISSYKKGFRVFLNFNENSYRIKDTPNIFEAGFRNYSGTIGLTESLKFAKKIGVEEIRKKNLSLIGYAEKLLKNIDGVKIYGPPPPDRSSILAFNIKNVDPVGLVEYLYRNNVIIAAREIGKEGIARISPHYYNTEQQIELCIELISEYYNKNVER